MKMEFVKSLVKERYFEEAKRAVKFFPTSKRVEALKIIFEGRLKQIGFLDRGQDVAELFPEPERTRGLERILAAGIYEEWEIWHIVDLFKLIGRAPNESEAKFVLPNGIRKSHLNGYLGSVKEFLSLLLESQRVKILKKIINALVEEGCDNALEAAKLFKIEVEKQALEKALRVHLNRSFLYGAKKAAKLLKRRLTTEEIEQMLIACPKGFGLLAREGTTEIIKLLPKRLEKEYAYVLKDHLK